VETVTFLFTDIEGSTALLRQLGSEVYAKVLAAHHALIRSSLAAHGRTESLDNVRMNLSQEQADRLYSEGTALSLEQAIDLALYSARA